MAIYNSRITFNEVVRCACIVYKENTPLIREIDNISLKEKPIMFKPRGNILPKMQVTPSSTSPSPQTPFPPSTVKIIHGWYIDLDMRLYYENAQKCVIRTSPIISIDGIFVTTTNGTKYQLGEMDKYIQQSLHHVYINRDNPLDCDNIPFLVNAAFDIYPQIV